MKHSDSTSSRAAFRGSPATIGTMFRFRSDRHPTVVSGWKQSRLELDTNATHFGFVGDGRTMLSCASGSFELSRGMYFAIPGEATVEGSGQGFVASLLEYQGLFQIGGPVEATGRLRYIDGCSDSLLIAPVMRGDPCLNLLYIPPYTDQTAHTHPSVRVGMIVDGEGRCQTPGQDVPLTAGLVFAIRTGGLHSFHTQEQSLRIVAWHPDSDFGPTHEQHPMLNRTIVNGRPVNSDRERP